MSNIYSAAELLRASLVEADIGVLRSQNLGVWPIYVGHLPEEPDNGICVYDTAGIKEGRLMKSGLSIRHPGWQVRVRANNHRSAWRKIKEIADHFDTVRREGLFIDGYTFTIIAVTQTTDILPIGQEPSGKRRDNFTLNGTVTLGEVIPI